MTATSAIKPPLILTLDELADALGSTPEELAGALERGHVIGVIRLLPDHEAGPFVLLPAFVAERLGVRRDGPGLRHGPGTARPRAPRRPARNRFREALDALHRASGPPAAA